MPQCEGRTCGEDGCGGVCGSCAEGLTCQEGRCANAQGCVPQCEGRTCGEDGCGGVCGTCAEGLTCQEGRCANAQGCVPQCEGRTCGEDGCGGVCGTCETGVCRVETGRCLPLRVEGRILLETQTVTYDAFHLPHFDQKLDIAGSGLPLSLHDKTGAVLGTTTTDDEGAFYFDVERLPERSDWISIIPAWYVEDSLKLAIFVANTTKKHPYDIWAWSLSLSDFGAPDDVGEMGDVRVTIDQGSGGLYLYQTLKLAYEELASHGFGKTLQALPGLGVLWKPGIYWSCGTCFYNGTEGGLEYGKETLRKTMYVGGDTSEESAWGYPTILHEFGHYVLAQRRDNSEGGEHLLNSAYDPNLAWSEGFATLYSLMAMTWREGTPVSQYWRVIDSGSYWLDYDHLFDATGFGTIVVPQPSLTHARAMKQNLAEAWVTYVVHHLVRGTADGASIGGEQGVFDALASARYTDCGKNNTCASEGTCGTYLPSFRTEPGADLVDFIDAVLCRSDLAEGMDEAIADYLISNGFPYDRSPVCPE